MDDVTVLYTTWPDAETAEAFGRAAVQARLAACANILAPMRSIYRWQGAVESASEILLIIKTSQDKLAELETTLHRLHSYELPEFLVLKIESGSNAYLNWLFANLTSNV